MKKLLKYLVLFLTITRVNLFSECQPQDHKYAINDEDFRYLHYLKIENIFDSVTVYCNYGEFKIINGNQSNYLYFESVNIYKYQWFQGDTIQGEDPIILEKSRTNTFTYSPNSEISFFRELSVEVPCNVEFPNENTDNLPWYAKAFIVPHHTILDNSEWCLQLRRASDKALLFTIDSVGILRNDDIIIAPYYGIEPLKMNHIRLLPNDYANTPVYLCISARRYGSTPYGMLLKLSSSHISLSSIMEYDSTNYLYTMKCNEDDKLFYDSVYFEKIIQYADSIYLIDSTLSSNFLDRIYFPDSLKGSFFMNRYFDTVHIGSNPTLVLYVDKNQKSSRLGSFENNHFFDNVTINKRTINSYKSNHHYFIIPLTYLLDNDEYFIEIYSLNGQRIMNIKPDDVYTINNRSNLKFYIPNSLAKGYYLVFLKNSKGTVITTTQLRQN